MAEERIVEERIVERPSSTTIVESRGSGMGVIFAIILVALIAVVAVFMITQNNREDAKADAITGAADSVGAAADKVGDAASEAVKKIP